MGLLIKSLVGVKIWREIVDMTDWGKWDKMQKEFFFSHLNQTYISLFHFPTHLACNQVKPSMESTGGKPSHMAVMSYEAWKCS